MINGTGTEEHEVDMAWARRLFNEHRFEELPPSLRQKALWALAYSKGYSMEAVAENYGATARSVRTWTAFFGIPLRKPGGHAPMTKRGARKC